MKSELVRVVLFVPSRGSPDVMMNPPPPKRPRGTSDASAQAAALLAEAERELAESHVEVDASLDANSLKRLILHFEKQINGNMALRMKYGDQPERFLDSELELYQALKALHAVAAQPDLFPVFVKSKCVPSLLGLLAHENTDIANDALDLLQEMTSADDAAPEDLLVLVDAMLEHGAASMLADNLSRLDDADDDDAGAAHSTLSIFESMLEARPETSPELAQKTPLLSWLLKRVKTRGFHAVKLYASELLALLLQQQPANQAHLGQKCDGILSLLTACAQYKRREPNDLEEAELVENIFNALCAALEIAENQALFLRAEGIELMVLTLKEGRYASRGALRCLDAALVSNGANCERFVDIRGFKTLFPLLGAAPSPQPSFAKGRGEKEAAQRAHDEHVAGILCTLFHQLADERRQRLLGKFAEDDLAKAERLLALRAAYDERVTEAEAVAEAAIDAEGEVEEDEEDEEDVKPTAEERIYLARMDAGQATLQRIDVILGYIATAKAKPLRVAVLRGLYDQGRSLHDVAINVDEDAKVTSSVSRPDPTRDERLRKMNDAVQALLLKYEKPAARADEDKAALDAGPDER